MDTHGGDVWFIYMKTRRMSLFSLFCTVGEEHKLLQTHKQTHTHMHMCVRAHTRTHTQHIQTCMHVVHVVMNEFFQRR